MTTEERLEKLERELAAVKRRNHRMIRSGFLLILACFTIAATSVPPERTTAPTSYTEELLDTEPQLTGIKYFEAAKKPAEPEISVLDKEPESADINEYFKGRIVVPKEPTAELAIVPPAKKPSERPEELPGGQPSALPPKAARPEMPKRPAWMDEIEKLDQPREYDPGFFRTNRFFVTCAGIAALIIVYFASRILWRIARRIAYRVENMNIERKRQIVLRIGVGMVVLAGLFPPLWHDQTFGYGFLFSGHGRIRIAQLCIEILLIGLLTAYALYTMKKTNGKYTMKKTNGKYAAMKKTNGK